MGDKEDGLVLARSLHCFEDDALVEAVEVGGGLVQQEEGRIVEEGARHADALAFAAGKRTAQLADRGLIPLGQAADETIQCRFFAGGFHFRVGGVPLGDLDVVLDGVVEQLGLLRHKALLPAEGGGVDLPDVAFAKADGAGADIPEPH